MTATHISSHRSGRSARGRWLAAVLGLALGGCDSFELDSVVGGRAFEDVLAIAQNPSANISTKSTEWSSMLLRAVTACNGAAHGTVRVGADGQVTRLSDQPMDRIVLQGLGKPADLVVHALQLDDTSGVRAALMFGHNIRYTLTKDGHAVRVIDSVHDNGALLRIQGSAELAEGEFMDVDVTIARGSDSEIDNSGVEFEANRSEIGTIRGPGFELNIWQARLFTIVSHGGQSASVNFRRNRSRLRRGGDTYVWDNVAIKASLRNGQPSNVDVEHDWFAQGNILKNGSVWGKFKLERHVGAAAVILETPGGDIVLERYHLQGDMASCRNGDECISYVCVGGKCSPQS